MIEANSFIKIGLIQMRCEKSAMAENIRKMETYIIEAEKRRIDIISFPEMSITGYAKPLKYPQAIIRLDGPEINAILKISMGRKVTILAGLIEENADGKPFITQAVIRNGELTEYYRKITIKDEENDWFSPGNIGHIFIHNNLTFGIAICADIGNEDLFGEYARKGAHMVFELAAPGLYGDQATRNWKSGFEWWEGQCLKLLGSYAQKYKIWIAVATQAGRTIDEDFPGGGYVFSPDGLRMLATPDWSPQALYLTLDMNRYEVTGV
jgi:predicted amidohydrolase